MTGGLLQSVLELSLLCILCPALTIANGIHNNGSNVSNKMIQTVLAGYHKEIRPHYDNRGPVMTFLDMSLRQIIELNEPKQTLSTNVWLRMYWSDNRLTWNSSEFSGIEKIILPSTLIWIPDLTLYDSAVKSSSSMSKYRVSVTKNGSISFQFPELLTSLCSIDTTYFPFDTQRCNLTFGSWAYDAFGIDIYNVSDHGKLSNYKEHVEWSVVRLTAMRIAPVYSGVSYPLIIFSLQIKRKPLFYIINLLFPSVLLSGVVIMGFLLPAESGEKVSLQVMVLLSLSVFQLILLDLMPPSSETFPIISIYFATSIVLVGLSLLMTVIGLNVYFRGHQGHTLSSLMSTLCLSWIGRLLCIHRPDKARKSSVTSKGELGLVTFKRRTSLFTISDCDACAQGSEMADDNQNGLVPFFMESILKYCRRISAAWFRTAERVRICTLVADIRLFRYSRLSKYHSIYSSAILQIAWIGVCSIVQ
ncbi:neuronal acetylcholine receptor subunit alpha-7-like [Gigantopelta aegis]|uniref:neuronal acetylcholine receptor subunit alpha-7-like n=1 Tax=Gigantopelta aegis TaxID=1735272 RepID=UPI001B88B006|nr:neuronal acetylcholine receptor subunit alpha-7-like [Gigantopelta aegis]